MIDEERPSHRAFQHMAMRRASRREDQNPGTEEFPGADPHSVSDLETVLIPEESTESGQPYGPVDDVFWTRISFNWASIDTRLAWICRVVAERRAAIIMTSRMTPAIGRE